MADGFVLLVFRAISLLSTWNSHGYVPSGVAMRMALDMHFDTAIDRLVQLVKSRTGPNGLLPPTPEQQKHERELVVQARLFCHLFFHDVNQCAAGLLLLSLSRESWI